MKRFLQVWIGTLIVKIGLAGFLPLSPDEAYYWVWSHHPQLSYYDHPPFVSWLLYLGHFFESWGSFVRTPTVIVGHLVFLVWYFILAPRFPWPKFKAWYILAMASPLIGFGSMVATPDVALLLFSALATYFFQQMLLHKKARDYFLFGASLGLGFCAKYHIVLLVLFLFCYLTFEKKWKDISFKNVPLTLLAGLIFCAPVLIWNYQNDFISFKFQLNHGLGSSKWEPEWTLNYILGEILMIFPPALYVAFKAKPDLEYRFLRYLAWGPLAFFFLSSFRGAVELNWPTAAFPAVFALVMFAQDPMKTAKRTAVFWSAIYILAAAAFTFLPRENAVAKPLKDAFRFRPLAALQSQYHPLYTGTYQIASTLWWENKTPIYKIRGMSRYDFYDTLPQSMPQEDTFYVIQENWSDLPDWVEKAGYKVEEVQKIEPHFIVVKVSKE